MNRNLPDSSIERLVDFIDQIVYLKSPHITGQNRRSTGPLYTH